MNGTYFIQSFCKAFTEKACDYDIHELMTLTQRYLGEMSVNLSHIDGSLRDVKQSLAYLSEIKVIPNDRSFTGAKQSLAYETIGLEKKLYFNPGFSV